MPGPSFRDCPHRSSVLHDFRREATARLDATLPAVRGLLRKMARPRPFNGTGMSTRARATLAGDLYALQSATGSSQRTAPRGAVKQPRLIFVMQRSSSRVDINQTRNCRRCLWNIDELTRALAAAHPSALVVRANPGELSFQEQYALFRAADVLVGVHSGSFGWGVFLTPSQSVLEIPLPGSPGLNNWVAATMGTRTATEQACELRAPYGRACSKIGGDADVPLMLRTIEDILARRPTSPVVWQQLGSRSDATVALLEQTRRRFAQQQAAQQRTHNASHQADTSHHVLGRPSRVDRLRHHTPSYVTDFRRRAAIEQMRRRQAQPQAALRGTRNISQAVNQGRLGKNAVSGRAQATLHHSISQRSRSVQGTL